jgi:hypothetical protein
MQRSYKFALFLLIAFPFTVPGQNYVNNPYTRFAIGDLITSGFSYNRSLGGSSVAIRPKNQINYLNPASYTSQDTLSFLFHAGLSGRTSMLSTKFENDRSSNMNMEYLAMGFPISRWWNFSMGLVPFNRIEYFFREYIDREDELVIEYKGHGGYNEFYFGTAFRFTKYLSAGFNANYLFGDLARERSIDIPGVTVASTKIAEDYIANDMCFRLGLQAHPVFTDKNDRKHTIILGATYDFASNIKIEYNSMTSRNFPSHVANPVRDTFSIVSDSINYLKLPVKLGIGLSYNYNDRLMFTLEYTKQDFSGGLGLATYEGLDLKEYSSFRFGAEYIPIPLSERTRARYYERMHYRLGGHYSNSYFALAGHDIVDYGMSIGVGLPWRNSQKLYTHTAFNISYEFGVRGTTENGLIKENYHIVTLGVTLFDFWFLKPKYD